MNKQEFENEISELKVRIALLELNKPDDENDAWKPEKHNFYFTVDWDGNISEVIWLNDKKEETAYSMGNIFKTKEDAEFEIERRKVFRELKQFACEFRYQKNNWEIVFRHDVKCIAFVRTDYISGVGLYFSSKEQAKKAVESVGEDRVKKYYLGVKE